MLWRARALPRSIQRHDFVHPLRAARSISNVRCVDLVHSQNGGTNYEDKEVKIAGLVRSVRKQKRFAFAHVSDGTTVQSLQAILSPEQAASLSTGSAVEVSGVWKKSPAKGQSHELQATNVTVTGDVDTQTYPIQKKYHTAEFLRSIPHLRLRTPFNSLLSRFRSEAIFTLTDFFRKHTEHGPFYEIQPPLITSSDCEGAGEVFTLAPKDVNEKDEQFFRDPKYLTVSSQLHLEAYAAELGSVWTLSPTFRAERSDTTRHLAEFYMLEVEIRNPNGLEDILRFTEDMIRYMVSNLRTPIIGQEVLNAKRTGEGGTEEMLEDGIAADDLGNRWDAVSGPDRWRRISYTEAIEHLETAEAKTEFQFKPFWSTGLQLEHERWLVNNLGNGGPIFVTDYPKAIKPFYMLPSHTEHKPQSQHKEDMETVANFDLLFPHVAEVVGGSLREHRLPHLIANMRQHGLLRTQKATAEVEEATYPYLHQDESLGALQWYADLRRYGSMPHGGFGLGFDRLLMYLTGATNVRDVVGFPRYWGRADC